MKVNTFYWNFTTFFFNFNEEEKNWKLNFKFGQVELSAQTWNLPNFKISAQTWNFKFGLPNFKIGQISSLGTTFMIFSSDLAMFFVYCQT